MSKNDTWTRSQVQRIARMVLGPLARVWAGPSEVSLGLERGGQRVVIATAPTYEELANKTFVESMRKRLLKVYPELAPKAEEKTPRED